MNGIEDKRPSDEKIRIAALKAAVKWGEGRAIDSDRVVRTAKKFENFIRTGG